MEINRREEKGIWLVIVPKRMKPLYNRVSLFRWKPDVLPQILKYKLLRCMVSKLTLYFKYAAYSR